MTWSNDPELQQLFKEELTERVGRLVEGARQMQQGATGDEMAGAMLREGHTIKGTGRVMGFEAISRAGQLLEQTWRGVQHSDIEPTPELGSALEGLSSVLPDAITADPEHGNPELAAALSALHKVLSSNPEKPAASEPTDDAAGTPDVERWDANGGSAEVDADLGGLLGALELWASEESVLVNAGRLYRLINLTAAVRIDAAALAARLGELDGAEHRDDDGAFVRLVDAARSVHLATVELEADAVRLAAVPLKEITNTLPQLVRYLAKKTGKEIRFETVGDDLTVDRLVLERLSDPIRQLIVNAIEHGVEPPPQREALGKSPTALIAVRAAIHDHQLELVVEDDGNGIDWTAVRRAAGRLGLLSPNDTADEHLLRSFLFSAGFSTSSRPSDLVGSGDGLAMVAGAVESLYGGLKLDTSPHSGTRVTITVPTSRALQRAVIVSAGGQQWGIAETSIAGVVSMSDVEMSAHSERLEMPWQDSTIPVMSFADAVGIALEEREIATHVIVVADRLGAIGFTVAGVIGRRDVAAKELGPLLAGPSHITGAALLGGGEVVLLVDVAKVAELLRSVRVAEVQPVARVLVVDDSQGARQVVAAALASNGFATSVAASVGEALIHLEAQGADAVVVDFSMPHADGVELVEAVRDRFGDLPVVMLSGVATHDDETRAKQAGVDAFFDKSDFREGALAETLRSLLAANAVRSTEVVR